MDASTQDRHPPIEREVAGAEELQARVDRLQALVCFLLMKNQRIRMELTTSKLCGCSNGSLWAHPPSDPSLSSYDHLF